MSDIEQPYPTFRIIGPQASPPYMPMPPLSLGADARSIQLFSSCLGVRATGGFLRRTACPVAGTERCAADGRARVFLAEAASTQAHSVMTAKSSAIAGERTMRTSPVSRAPPRNGQAR